MQQKLKESYQDFEHTFEDLLKQADKEPVTIEDLLKTLSGRGKLLLLIFLSLGFGQIPGVALFLGPVIIYLGIRVAIGNSFIWLPSSWKKKKLPSYFLTKALRQVLGVLKFMRRWSRPRYQWAIHNKSTRIINGIMIALVGLSFTLCPPIPFTGLLAFFCIFSIAIGILNDDGIYILAGYGWTAIYFTVVVILLKYCSLQRLIAYFFKL